ncbi:MAG: FtsX-like permease family protein [Actinomycetia bacterium]|nr:FtsX-like permease family protein [Actinomycetes bacterium]
MTAVLRLARRSLRLHLGRSALVVLLIAIPVAAGVAVATANRSSRVTAQEELRSQYGSAVMVVEHHLSVWGEWAIPSADRSAVAERRHQASEELRQAMADLPGPMVERIQYGWWGDGNWRLVDLDLENPVAEGVFRMEAGRPAAAAGEAVLSTHLADQLGVGVGGRADIPLVGAVEVVGTLVDVTAHRDNVIVVAAGQIPALERFDLIELRSDHQLQTFLLGHSLSPEDQEALRSEFGAAVDIFDATEFRAYGDRAHGDGAFDPFNRPGQLSTLITGVLLVEAALLAAAAFSVGIRRRIHQAGQLAAVGANPQQVRRVFLAEAGFLGGVGAVVGSVLGLTLVWLNRGRFETRLVEDLRWDLADVIGPALLATAGALAAAWLPARTAARTPVVTALAGRVPPARLPRWYAGGGLVVAGVGLALIGWGSNQVGIGDRGDLPAVANSIGALLMLAGAVAVAAVILGWLGSRSGRFPGLLRLATRDSARQRLRSGSAVASLVALFTGVVVIGTGMASATDSWVPDHEGMSDDLIVLDGHLGSGFDEGLSNEEMLSWIGEFVAVAEVVEVREARTASSGYLELRPVDGRSGSAPSYHRLGVADEATLDLLGVSPAGRELIGAGRIIDVHPDSRSGRVSVALHDPTWSQPPRNGGILAVERAEAARYSGDEFVGYLASAGTIEELGFVIEAGPVMIRTDAALTQSQMRGIYLAPYGLAVSGPFDGPSVPTPGQVLAIIIGAITALALVISLVVAALVATESDRDIQTMVAVGAPPRIRPRLLAVQTWYHGTVALALAIPAGLLIANAVLNNDRFDFEFRVPWATLGVLALVPVLSALVTALVMRSAVPAVSRRLT